MSSCLPMILLCFQQSLICFKQQIYLMRTLIKFEDGLNSGTRLLIRTQQNKFKKSFFQKNFGNLLILISTFRNLRLKKCKPKSIQGLDQTKKVRFKEHLKDEFAKVNRGIGNLKKLSGALPRHSLISLYKSFIRPHLDYADIIYDQPSNLNLCNKIETCQYNAALAITGAIRGSSKEKLYQELGFECLSSRRWLRKLCTFHRIVRNKSPGYLYKYILPGDRAYLTLNSNNIKQFFVDPNTLLALFFPIQLRTGIS